MAEEDGLVLLDCHGPCKRTGLSPSEFSKRNNPRGRQYECKVCRAVADKKRKKTLAKRTNKVKHRRGLRFEAVQRLIDHKPIADTVRTFNFVLRLLLEEQLLFFHGQGLKTLPGKVRLSKLVETSLYAIQLELQRINSNATSILKDEQERLKADPGLELVEKVAAFHLLGVSPSASKEEVKGAYKELALQRHPDKGGSTDSMQILNAAFTLIMGGFGNGNHAEESIGDQSSQDLEPEEEEAQG